MTVEEKIERLWDRHQIENLMGAYANLHTARMHESTSELFDLNREDIWVEVGGLGVFKGREGVRRFFVDHHYSMEGDGKGIMNIHTLTTPIIQVAEDGKTAKGTWMSPGAETRIRDEDGELICVWIWGRYEVDFIKNKEEEWKFWHFKIINDFMTDYRHSWVDTECRLGQKIRKEIPDTDASCSFEDGYSKTNRKGLFPEIPKPYKTSNI